MKPILFNTEMVQAILEGRKTVTRRKIDRDIINCCDVDTDGTLLDYQNCDGDFINPVDLCKYKAGDILWVRETWCHHPVGDWYGYKADGDYRDVDLKWRPSIHMPKSAARIFLRVTDVRVERLQDISCLDAISEGVKPVYSEYENCNGLLLGSSFEVDERETIKRFGQLWDSTIKKQSIDKYSWEANPWVWVIEFEGVEVD